MSRKSERQVQVKNQNEKSKEQITEKEENGSRRQVRREDLKERSRYTEQFTEKEERMIPKERKLLGAKK